MSSRWSRLVPHRERELCGHPGALCPPRRRGRPRGRAVRRRQQRFPPSTSRSRRPRSASAGRSIRRGQHRLDRTGVKEAGVILFLLKPGVTPAKSIRSSKARRRARIRTPRASTARSCSTPKPTRARRPKRRPCSRPGSTSRLNAEGESPAKGAHATSRSRLAASPVALPAPQATDKHDRVRLPRPGHAASRRARALRKRRLPRAHGHRASRSRARRPPRRSSRHC